MLEEKHLVLFWQAHAELISCDVIDTLWIFEHRQLEAKLILLL